MRVTFWLWRDGASLPQKRALDYLPGLQSPVFQDESSIEEGKEEDCIDCDNTESDAEDTASDLTTGPIIQLERRGLMLSASALDHCAEISRLTSFPDNYHGQDPSCNGEIEWYRP